MSEGGDLLRFAGDVLHGIGLALGMNPDAVQIVERHPETGWIIMAIAVLAGASTLLGHSVVLFLNRVHPTRFMVSLFVNGVILALSFLAWGRVLGPQPYASAHDLLTAFAEPRADTDTRGKP